MMEWQLNLQAGKATVHVEFKGGFENEYGIHPATFMTKDPIIQNVIERSSYFVCGKITLLDSKDLGLSASEIAEQKRKADAEAKRIAEQKANDVKAIAEQKREVVKDEVQDAEDTQLGSGTGDEGKSDDGDNAPDIPDTGTEDDLETVKVSCNQDAKDYLDEHFGTQSGLRNWDAILATGKAHGILFVKE